MDYDLIVIGAGWAGFNAAIKAKEAGLKVALIEKERIGGTCLNRGCIPTKALIRSAKIYTLAKKSDIFGITLSDLKIDFAAIQKRKEAIINQLMSGIEFMLKGVEILNGAAEFISASGIKVGERTISAKDILIATGSKPMELKNLRFDGKKVISSDEILNLKEIPQSLLIIGGGVIGCEFASLFSALGTKVSVVELMPQLLPGQDPQISRKLETIFKKKGIKLLLNTDASTLDLAQFDLVLLCIGRVPNTESLNLQKVGLKTEKNKILVDEYLRTNISHIYAAGDCTGQVMLAHFASYQGEIAAENIINPAHPKKADNPNVPNCIFTDPEIASVGLTEEDTKNKGFVQIKINTFNFLGSGMARLLDETEGFVKIISDKTTDRILGSSLIGPHATELIGILTLAINSRLTVSQIRETIFAHPTLSEAINEALK